MSVPLSSSGNQSEPAGPPPTETESSIQGLQDSLLALSQPDRCGSPSIELNINPVHCDLTILLSQVQ